MNGNGKRIGTLLCCAVLLSAAIPLLPLASASYPVMQAEEWTNTGYVTVGEMHWHTNLNFGVTGYSKSITLDRGERLVIKADYDLYHGIGLQKWKCSLKVYNPYGSLIGSDYAYVRVSQGGSGVLSVSFTPTIAGTYKCLLRLEYGDNECGSDYGYVRVYFRNRPPVALFTVTPSSGNTGTSFNFDASASYDSDPGDFIAKYEWDWSNNGVYDYSSSNATATYRYDSIGNYTVKLRVTDNDGAQATTTKTITVENRPPIASFTVEPSSGNTQTPFQFDASASTDPDGSIVKYEWDWDGDGIYDYTSTDPKAAHQYLEPETYTVGLRVTDDLGATDTTTKTITVENQPPKALFTVNPSSGDTTTPFYFNASASTDPDGSIVKYEWDWNGDGIVDYASTGPTATHQYLEPGTYTVTLTVTDCYGAISSVTEEVEVMQIFEGSCRDKERVEFGVSMDSPGTIKVTLDWDNPENDLDLFLIDESGKIIASSTGTMNHEEITAQVSAGVYTVRVYGYSVVGEQEFEGTCNYPINP